MTSYYNLVALKIERVNVAPCYRLTAIGKGIPQYCKCAACLARQDFGRIVSPV